MAVKVAEDGRVRVPEEMIRELGLRDGDTLVCEVRDGQARLWKSENKDDPQQVPQASLAGKNSV